MSAPILSFLGATGTVTGSKFLVETDRARVIYDDDPQRLVSRLVECYRTEHFRRPSTLHDIPSTAD